jgi:cytochrome c-type biogenesis protein CcmH
MRKALLVITFICAVLGSGASSLRAQEQPDHLNHRATTMYQQVLSPFCPGRSLNDCPSSKAAELKDQMRDRLAQGEAPEAIIEAVIAQYGEQYRAVPRFSGVGMFVWLIPLSFVVLGGLVALKVSSGRKGAKSAPVQPPLSPEVQRRVEEELSRLD